MAAKDTLRKLANAMPVMNKKVQAQQQAAKDINLQQQIAKAPAAIPQGAVTLGAQAMGAQQAQMAGQQALSQEQQRQQQLSALTQSAQQAAQAQIAKDLGTRELALGNQKLASQERVGERGRDVDSKILADQLEFNKDELGRTMYKDSQELDMAVLFAENEQDLSNNLQSIEQATQEDIQFMEAVQKKLQSLLENEHLLNESRLDRGTQEYIKKLKADTEQLMQQKAMDAANQKAKIGALGGIVGTIVGAIWGGAGGSQAGGAIGSGLGGAIGGAGANMNV